MKGYRPPITSWRAFVDCEQIGYRFSTREEAINAANRHIAKYETPEAVVVIRPSYTPVSSTAKAPSSQDLSTV